MAFRNTNCFAFANLAILFQKRHGAEGFRLDEIEALDPAGANVAHAKLYLAAGYLRR